MNVVTFFSLLLFPLSLFLLLTRTRRTPSVKVPPGSLGLPFIGQSFSFLRAFRSNQAEQWVGERIKDYGAISKLTLFGTPTVLLVGPAANKFMFTASGDMLTINQPKSMRKILGSRNILELNGEDHKRVRRALGLFLRPEVLKIYVGKIDGEVKHHIEKHWKGKEKVKVLPLVKTLTFDIICSLLFGVERGRMRDKLLSDFIDIMVGLWSLPINMPFTRFNRSIKASTRIRRVLSEHIRAKRVSLEKGLESPKQDLITCLLSFGNQDEVEQDVITEEEIIDNTIAIMIAGYDTSSSLITFIMQRLANDPAIYHGVLDEQEEIAQSKSGGEVLTWTDLARMKYTWRVAMETLRMIPPSFGGFRKVLKDIEYGGYLIPKGWQIFWTAHSTHMDEGIFPEPNKFDPARFDNQKTVTPYSFVAFGGGARICPGYELARIETLVTIHYMVTQFKWRLCCTDKTIIRDPIPAPSQGLPIQLRRRIADIATYIPIMKLI